MCCIPGSRLGAQTRCINTNSSVKLESPTNAFPSIVSNLDPASSLRERMWVTQQRPQVQQYTHSRSIVGPLISNTRAWITDKSMLARPLRMITSSNPLLHRRIKQTYKDVRADSMSNTLDSSVRNSDAPLKSLRCCERKTSSRVNTNSVSREVMIPKAPPASSRSLVAPDKSLQ